MRGQKYNDDIRERAFALMATNNSISAVAKAVGIPRSTLKGWLAKRESEEPDAGEAERQRNKERFVTDAWKSIHAGQALLIRRLERALQHEDTLDRMMDEFTSGAEQLNADQLKAMIRKFEDLKIMDIGKLAVVLGTMYDKQALIAKEATARVEVAEVKFEDL